METHQKKSPASSWLKAFFFIAVCTAAGTAYVSNAKEEAPAAAHTPPPPAAEFMVMQAQPVRIWTQFSGRLAAVDTAEIKPLVGGELVKVNITDGQQVEKGDLLFVIDPRPYQAAIKQIEAQLASAKSRAKLAKDELLRTERLVKNKLVSDSVYDAAKNEYQVSNASINEVESALVKAKIDLDYCYIKAPFAGRVSRAELTVGNIIEVNAGAPVLTTLVADNSLYAEFDVDEQTYIRSVRSQGDITKMPVKMTLAADESVEYSGHIHSFDNQLDTSSGTIRARAIIDNTDGVLIPGMYANVKLGEVAKRDALLLPERAIGTNQDKKYVYVINDDNVATYQEVKLGAYHQQQRVVLAGLQGGERVIVNGLSHIRPNSPVTPKAVMSQQDSSVQ